jgi:CRISPR/Cas system-associated exonuclease Cas4 (RecB family)
MAPATFSVSEVRAAATCPRISYFDAEATRRKGLKTRSMTRLWKAGDAETACGSLFHNAIEVFNRRALEAIEVRAAIAGDPAPRAIEQALRAYVNLHCVNLDALASKPAVQQQAFIRAVAIYMGELAAIVADARARGKPAAEIIDQLFGDRRRRVDVTFQVGPHGEPVHVTGTLDYVFYDWRTAHHRIVDYKLTPAGEPSNDLFQVALYALMHNVQHRTTPDIGVLYLHPERRMVEMSWDQVHGRRHKLFDLLASLAGWVRYDEAGRTGLMPPGEPSWCPQCKWDRQGQCLSRLGPKHEGVRLHHWADAATGLSAAGAEPTVDVGETDGPTRSWAEEVEPEPADPGPPAPSDSLRIGTTSPGGAPVDLPIAALPTHVAVVGAAGSGKTWMAKVVVEEAIRAGVPVLAIDPQGDLVQFLRPSAEPPGLSDADRAMRREFLERVEPRIWTPGSSHGRRLSLDPIHLSGRAELSRITDPDRREEEWQGMLGVAAAQLVGLAKVGGEADSQQTFLLQVFRSLAAGEHGRDVSLEAIAAAASDPESIGLDDPDQIIKKSERTKLARKLHALRLGPAATLFTGGIRLDLDAMCRPDESGRMPLNVIYLNALADDDLKHFFTAALAAEVYRWMITSLDATPGRPGILFYLDEARDYIPAGTARPPAKGPLIRLFTQGRKYGVACLLCTQSPRSIDYNVFGNCSTKLVGRLESQQDVERVAQWFTTEGPIPPWIRGRKGAPAGSFVGRWPRIPAALEGRPFRSRPLFSLHEGAWSPDRLERESRER